jgi:hypothetical protein
VKSKKKRKRKKERKNKERKKEKKEKFSKVGEGEITYRQKRESILRPSVGAAAVCRNKTTLL